VDCNPDIYVPLDRPVLNLLQDSYFPYGAKRSYVVTYVKHGSDLPLATGILDSWRMKLHTLCSNSVGAFDSHEKEESSQGDRRRCRHQRRAHGDEESAKVKGWQPTFASDPAGSMVDPSSQDGSRCLGYIALHRSPTLYLDRLMLVSPPAVCFMPSSTWATYYYWVMKLEGDSCIN
jgi:hypothetical protein